MRDYGGHISFWPRLPSEWRRLHFRLTIRGSFVHVGIGSQAATYTLQQGAGLRFEHEGEPLELWPGAPRIVRPVSAVSPEAVAPARGLTV